jgi:hypothetical protein
VGASGRESLTAEKNRDRLGFSTQPAHTQIVAYVGSPVMPCYACSDMLVAGQYAADRSGSPTNYLVALALLPSSCCHPHHATRLGFDPDLQQLCRYREIRLEPFSRCLRSASRRPSSVSRKLIHIARVPAWNLCQDLCLISRNLNRVAFWLVTSSLDVDVWSNLISLPSLCLPVLRSATGHDSINCPAVSRQ